MSIEKGLSSKYFELVHMHTRANHEAAKWAEGMMHQLTHIYSQDGSKKKIVTRVNKTLKSTMGVPSDDAILSEQIRLHSNALNNRRTWLNNELERLNGFDKTNSAVDFSDVTSWLISHVNQMPIVLNYIRQCARDRSNIDTGEPDDFFEVYSFRIAKKIRLAMMQDTLLLPPIQRELSRKVVDCELDFFLKTLGEDWLEKMRVYEKEKHDLVGAIAGDNLTDDQRPCLFQLCDPSKAQACLDSFGSGGGKLSTVDKNALNEITEQNGLLLLASVPTEYIKILTGFRNRFPNFGVLADIISSHLNLITLGGNNIPLELSSRPLILDGEVGIGKTMALRYLSNAFGVGFKVIGCAELTNGFDLTGQSRGWTSGKMGMIARMLICEHEANGIIVLDELDKTHGSESNFPPTNALYTLLESETSANFKDEFLDFEIDASKLIWLGTSNYYNKIPEPIRDRARKVLIPTPDVQQRITIVQYLYSDLRKKNAHAWGKYFVDQLNDDVAFLIAGVAGISVRGMRDILIECLAKVASESSRPVADGTQVVTEGLASKVIRSLPVEVQAGRPIGFIH